MTAPPKKKPGKKDILEEVIRRTGLSRNTCRELLRSGWTYREGLHSPSAFVQTPPQVHTHNLKEN